MTKNEHRKKGLNKAYFLLKSSEEALAGHADNKEIVLQIQEIRNRISAEFEKCDEPTTLCELLLNNEL